MVAALNKRDALSGQPFCYSVVPEVGIEQVS